MLINHSIIGWHGSWKLREIPRCWINRRQQHNDRQDISGTELVLFSATCQRVQISYIFSQMRCVCTILAVCDRQGEKRWLSRENRTGLSVQSCWNLVLMEVAKRPFQNLLRLYLTLRMRFKNGSSVSPWCLSMAEKGRLMFVSLSWEGL